MKKKYFYTTVLTVAEAAVKRGIHNPYQLHLKTGISVPRSKKLWEGTGKFECADINALCDGLPCKIKDIIKRVPKGSD
jgi:DNA-binding Xre family transcriptional regulator